MKEYERVRSIISVAAIGGHLRIRFRQHTQRLLIPLCTYLATNGLVAQLVANKRQSSCEVKSEAGKSGRYRHDALRQAPSF